MRQNRRSTVAYFLSGDLVRDLVNKALDRLIEKYMEPHLRTKAKKRGFEDRFERALLDLKERGAAHASRRAYMLARPLNYDNDPPVFAAIRSAVNKKWAMLSLALGTGGLLILAARLSDEIPSSLTSFLALLVLVLVCLTSYLRWFRLVEGDLNWEASLRVLRQYEEIIAGRLWRGKDVTIVATERTTPATEPGPVGLAHICRTQSGVWFLFEVRVSFGRISWQELRYLSDEKARDRLQRHKRAYCTWFGVPPAV